MTAAMPSQFIPPIDKLLWPVSLLIKYGPYYLGKCGLRGRWNREGVSGLVIKSWMLHTFSIQSWEKTNPMECQWKTQFETNKNKQTVNILLIRFSRRSCSNVVSLKVTYILFAFDMFFFVDVLMWLNYLLGCCGRIAVPLTVKFWLISSFLVKVPLSIFLIHWQSCNVHTPK